MQVQVDADTIFARPGKDPKDVSVKEILVPPPRAWK